MTSDSEIKKNVEHELEWDADIHAAEIGVIVNDSVVTLTGFVRSYSQKLQAERAAKRIGGVRAVANDIAVNLGSTTRADPDIARDAVAVLKAQLPHAWDALKTIVNHGYLRLEGEVEWHFQRTRAEEAVRRIHGVKGVSNLISLRPTVQPLEIKRKIEDALKRNAEIEASHITVEANGGEVTLRGTVQTWGEREAAEQAAWLAPGVVHIENRITMAI